VIAPLSGVLAASFALVVFGLLGITFLILFLTSHHRPDGGPVTTHRTRLWTGLGVLAAAAVIGGVGCYRVAGEPLLNRQIPFLASAGIVVVLLSVLGGSLIIAEQLRNDQHRMTELEDAVRALTEALAPRIEEPARRPLVEELPVAKPRRSRAAARPRTAAESRP
jgi:hypothetical protein